MPPRKRQKTCSVNELPDLLLAKIFSYLPTKDRFQLSAVCKQWLSASKIPWSDVKLLDLSGIPSNKINPVLGLCAVVNEITANNQKIILDDDAMPTILSHLQSLKLYDVCFALQDSGSKNRIARKYERLLSEYLDRFPMLHELIWHNITSVDSDGNRITGKTQDSSNAAGFRSSFPDLSAAMATTLRRLQISFDSGTLVDGKNLVAALGQFHLLECLYLGGGGVLVSSDRTIFEKFYIVLENMPNLRELCPIAVKVCVRVGFTQWSVICNPCLNSLANIACTKLLKLEVLVFASPTYIATAGLSRLLASHPTLKILAIAGEDDSLKDKFETQPSFTPRILPGRSLLSPFDQRPLPSLQVFAVGPVLRYVRFTLPQPGAAEFTEIDCTMPQFLPKPEVAEISKEIWTAKIIRECANHGMKPWGNPNAHNVFYSSNSPQFHGAQ